MKSSIKLLSLALAAMTFTSGCTKKNTSSSNAAKPKVEAEKPPTGPIKNDPTTTQTLSEEEAKAKALKEAEAKAANEKAAKEAEEKTKLEKEEEEKKKKSSSAQVIVDKPGAVVAAAPTASQSTLPLPTPQPAPVTPAPTVVASASTGSATAPAAPVTPVPSAAPIKTATVEEIFEKCFSNLVNKFVDASPGKNQIQPLELFNLKYSSAKACGSDVVGSKIDDFDEKLTMAIVEIVLEKYPQSEENVKFFFETENSNADKAARNKIYEARKLSAKTPGAAGTSAKPLTAAPTAVVVPTSPATTVNTNAATDVKNDKTSVIAFEKCYTNEVNMFLAGQKKEKEIILPLDLFTIKYAATTNCNFASVEKKIENLDGLMTRKVIKLATVPFNTSTSSFEKFQKIEDDKTQTKEMRKSIYKNMATNAPAITAKVQVAAAPKVATANSASQSTPAKTLVTVASAKVTAPSPNSLEEKYEKCIEDGAKEQIEKMKSEKKLVITPKELAGIKHAQSEFCGRSNGSNEKLDARVVDKIVAAAKTSFDNCADAFKFFAETENKKINKDAKNKLYDSFVPTNKTSTVAASVTASKTGATALEPAKKGNKVEVSKTASEFEICLRKEAPILVSLLADASTKRTLENPTQLYVISQMLPGLCNKDVGYEANLVNKVIIELVTAKFPNGKEIIAFYVQGEKQKLSPADKMKLYSIFSTGVEINSSKVRFEGPIEKELSTGNIVTYTIASYTGDLNIKVKSAKKDATDKKISLNQIPRSSLRYVLDFTVKANQTQSLAILDGQNTFPLEFVFTKGSLAQFKAGEDVTVELTQDSWFKVLKAQLQQVIENDIKESAHADFVYSKDPKESREVRQCVLSTKDIKCMDPDFKTRAMVNPASGLNPKKEK